MEKFLNKITSTGYKWSNSCAPSTETPLTHCFFEGIPFLISSPISLWGNKNWTPQYKDQDDGKIPEQNELNRLQIVQFVCPKYRNPGVSLFFESIPFLISSPISLWGWGYTNWTPQYKDQDDGKIPEQNQLNSLQMVQFKCSRVRNPLVLIHL